MNIYLRIVFILYPRIINFSTLFKPVAFQSTIDNPIEPGKSIDDKEYQLDIVVKLNGNITINLEMQVVNYHNWSARSLCYLCRKFDSVARGEDYNTAQPVYQIGFLDFTLFEDHPEFFARYQVIVQWPIIPQSARLLWYNSR